MSTITFKNAADVNDLGGKQVNISVVRWPMEGLCRKIYVYNPVRGGQFFEREIRVFGDPRIITSHRIRILDNY